MRSNVPNGTAPEERAAIKNKFRRKTTAKMNVGRTVAVKNAFFPRSVPPRDT
jgi:hypothetical protein